MIGVKLSLAFFVEKNSYHNPNGNRALSLTLNVYTTVIPRKRQVMLKLTLNVRNALNIANILLEYFVVR